VKVRKNSAGGQGRIAAGSWHGGESYSAGSAGRLAQVAKYILGKTVPHISRRNKPLGGKPPRVGNVMQVKKNVSSEFLWHNWSRNAHGYVANQALSTCLVKNNGEG
jgi:hypothetical protein